MYVEIKYEDSTLLTNDVRDVYHFIVKNMKSQETCHNLINDLIRVFFDISDVFYSGYGFEVKILN